MTDLDSFQHHRPVLMALAYRMLGDVARAEDIVQDAWVRWQTTDTSIDNPKAFLVTMVMRLCLNTLDSAQARREVSRGDQLPEPVSLADAGIARVDALDRISMAFLVLLQRLTPAERAVLLLHEVFDFSHAEIAPLVGKNETACRQLLKRAREQVSSERRSLTVSPDVHRRLLRAFMRAAAAGDLTELTKLLADDAVLVVDPGSTGGTYGRVRNLPGPLVGAVKIASFVAAVAPQGATGLATRECELNGQPAVLVLRDGQPYTAILLSVAGDKITGVFMHADAARLRHVGPVD
jgi:RNA polymerase sigma-70 factor (ECF subfamily)